MSTESLKTKDGADAQIKLYPPDEIQDKNGLLGWGIRTLRSMIGDSNYTGDLDPLGDIQVLNPTEAAKYIGVEQTGSLNYWIRKYEKDLGKKIKAVNKEGKHGQVFLSDDLRPLRIFYMMNKGKIDPEKFAQK